MSAAGDMRNRKADSAAKAMGDMLLKGYKMLAVSCEICNNVLMQDKLGNNICVSCRNEEQARSVQMDFGVQNEIPEVKKEKEPSNEAKSGQSFEEVETTLRNEIKFFSTELALTKDLPLKMQYVSYIHQCVETIKSLRMIK